MMETAKFQIQKLYSLLLMFILRVIFFFFLSLHPILLMFFICEYKTKRDYMVKRQTKAILIIFRRAQLNLGTRRGMYNKRQHTKTFQNFNRMSNADDCLNTLLELIYTKKLCCLRKSGIEELRWRRNRTGRLLFSPINSSKDHLNTEQTAQNNF